MCCSSTEHAHTKRLHFLIALLTWLATAKLAEVPIKMLEASIVKPTTSASVFGLRANQNVGSVNR